MAVILKSCQPVRFPPYSIQYEQNLTPLEEALPVCRFQASCMVRLSKVGSQYESYTEYFIYIPSTPYW